MASLGSVQWLMKHLKGSKPIRYIGGGVNGRVFETNDGKILKIVANNAPQEWTSLLRLQGTRIVPRFNKKNVMKLKIATNRSKNLLRKTLNMHKVGNFLTIFTMGKVGGGHAFTLKNYVKKFPKINMQPVRNRIFHIIDEMHIRGISHGNLHMGNILVTADSQGRLTGMWVIDFGRSRMIPLGMTERKFYDLKPTPNIHSLYPVYNGGSRKNINMSKFFGRYNDDRSELMRLYRENIHNNLKLLKSPSKISSVRRTKSVGSSVK